MATSERLVVRGRREGPAARLPAAPPDHQSQSTNFSSGLWAAILFVSSEFMFFAALFTTYFYLRGRIPHWEPVFGEKPLWQGLPLAITVLLLASSVTMQLAVWAIQKNKLTAAKAWMVATLVLGFTFLGGQAYEYMHLGFLLKDGIFAGVFFLLTGLHGAHVTGGALFIVYCTIRTFKNHFGPQRHLAVEAASIYWHFVDVIWVGLFTTIYIVG